MLTALDKETMQVKNVQSTSDGRLCVESNFRYEDLGEIFNGDSGGSAYQVAAGAVVYSGIYSDLDWVRNVVLITKATNASTYAVYINRRDFQRPGGRILSAGIWNRLW